MIPEPYSNWLIALSVALAVTAAACAVTRYIRGHATDADTRRSLHLAQTGVVLLAAAALTAFLAGWPAVGVFWLIGSCAEGAAAANLRIRAALRRHAAAVTAAAARTYGVPAPTTPDWLADPAPTDPDRAQPVGLAGWCRHGVGMLDACDTCTADAAFDAAVRREYGPGSQEGGRA